MGIGRGKLAEAVQIDSLFNAKRIVAATVYYNGGAFTTTANLIDTAGFNNAEIIISTGLCQGADLAVANAVIECDTNSPLAATAVTSASFTSITSATTAGVEIGSLSTKATKRYIGLKTSFVGSPITIDFSAVMVMGKPDTQATTQTLVFDL